MKPCTWHLCKVVKAHTVLKSVNPLLSWQALDWLNQHECGGTNVMFGLRCFTASNWHVWLNCLDCRDTASNLFTLWCHTHETTERTVWITALAASNLFYLIFKISSAWQLDLSDVMKQVSDLAAPARVQMLFHGWDLSHCWHNGSWLTSGSSCSKAL